MFHSWSFSDPVQCALERINWKQSFSIKSTKVDLYQFLHTGTLALASSVPFSFLISMQIGPQRRIDHHHSNDAPSQASQQRRPLDGSYQRLVCRSVIWLKCKSSTGPLSSLLSPSKSGRLFWCFWIDHNVPFGRPTLWTRPCLKAMMIYGLTTVLAMNFEMYYNFKPLKLFRKTGNSWTFHHFCCHSIGT